MKILDNNALNFIMNNRTQLSEYFYITTDVKNECEAWFEDALPKEIHDICEKDFFSKATYLGYYKEMLNKHSGRSFYNMTGFGDISILALLKTIKLENKGKLIGEDCIIITSDGPLVKKIKSEFADMSDDFDKSIKIFKAEEYFV